MVKGTPLGVTISLAKMKMVCSILIPNTYQKLFESLFHVAFIIISDIENYFWLGAHQLYQQLFLSFPLYLSLIY